MVAYLIFSPMTALAVGYTLEMPVPGMPQTVSNPAQYIQYFFIFGLSLIGFLAVAALVVGGIMWMIGGSITSTEKAKNIIVGAVSGVVLLLCSYLLLYTIDPSLTNLTPKKLDIVNIPKVQGGPDTSTPEDAVTKPIQPPEGQPSSTLKDAVDKFGQDLTPNNTLVLIDKSDRKLYIYKDGYIIGSTDINIGKAENNRPGTLIGGQQGDAITPIGDFTITNDERHDINGVYTQDGKSHLGTSFLGISAKDEKGNYRGIGIHGSPDDSLRPTNGCIRVKNADSDLLFSVLKPGTPVKIQA